RRQKKGITQVSSLGRVHFLSPIRRKSNPAEVAEEFLKLGARTPSDRHYCVPRHGGPKPVEIELAKTDLADIFLLKHGPEPLNIEPRNSICAFRGIHFLEESCFVLRFGKREWLIEKGCAFLTERGRLHQYSHLQGTPPDIVLSVRFSTRLLECMHDELPATRLAELDSFIGIRNDLRFLRWRLD